MKEQPVRFFDRYSSWDAAENAWDVRAARFKKSNRLQQLKELPNLPGIRKRTRENLRWKALMYLLIHDKKKVFPKFVSRKPLRYLAALARSYLRKKSYLRDGDFYLYGISDTGQFKALLAKPDSILAVGFSYCHKPFECPSGRFTEECIHDPENPVCGQCFIGKCMHSIPRHRTIPLVIPTVHYIGEKMLELRHEYPNREILFVITACELTLEMFGDWGNMIGIKGIGVRLDGQICNTMRAFEASEVGIKPGLAVVLNDTQDRILKLIEFRRSKTEI